MHFIFVHLPAESRSAAAVGAALATAGRLLLAGVPDRVVEGALTPGRTWLAAWDDSAAADRAAAGLGAAADPAGAALRIEGTGAAPADDETAFIVANHTVTDAAGFQPYVADVARVTALFGGRFLARAGKTTRIFGAIEAGRSVILAFADRAAAERFYDAPEYAPLLALRLVTTRPNMVLAPAAGR